jgi:hypothetical protein
MGDLGEAGGMSTTISALYDRTIRLIDEVKARRPDLELHDYVPLLPGQYGVRWIRGNRKARVVLRDDEEGMEVFVDGDGRGEEYLSWDATVRWIARFGKR